MNKAWMALGLVTLWGCTGGSPNNPFETTTVEEVRSYAPPGTNLTTATIKGRVFAYLPSHPKLTVAVVTPGTSTDNNTLAASAVTNGTYTLSLPAQSTLESDAAVAYHERWNMVLFDDLNGNVKYDYSVGGTRSAERDVAIAILENYRLGYKGYDSSKNKFSSFLTHSDLQKGWVVVQIPSFKLRRFNQDFTQDFNITENNQAAEASKALRQKP